MKLKNPLSDIHNITIVPGYLNLESQEAFESRNAPGRRDFLEKLAAGTGLVGILEACGGSSSSGPSPNPTPTPPFGGSSVAVNVYDINDGFKTQVSVPVQSGSMSLNPTSLASSAGITGSDGHVALRSGRGLGALLGEYNGTQSITPTTGEVSAFLRPAGPRYNLMSSAQLFNGRTYNFGFDSEAGIVGPADFWPRVFSHLVDAFKAKDGTVYATISFDPNAKGNYTAGFGNENHQSAGYRKVTATTIKGYVLGSNSFFPLDYESAVKTGAMEPWEAIFKVDDIAGDNTSQTIVFPTSSGFSPEGLSLTRDTLTRLS